MWLCEFKKPGATHRRHQPVMASVYSEGIDDPIVSSEALLTEATSPNWYDIAFSNER